MGPDAVQVVLVGLSRSSAARQREFAAELVRELQELAAALAAPAGTSRLPSAPGARFGMSFYSTRSFDLGGGVSGFGVWGIFFKILNTKPQPLSGAAAAFWL